MEKSVHLKFDYLLYRIAVVKKTIFDIFISTFFCLVDNELNIISGRN